MFNIKNRITKFDRLMAAISFAEADEREMAMEVMGREDLKKKEKRTGIRIKRQKHERPDMRI
jgi:hypothetical protein